MSYKDFSDADLLLAFSESHDRKAYEALYGRYSNLLINYVNWMSKENEKSKDIVQTIFLNLLQKPDLLLTVSNFKNYLYTAAKNAWTNELRSRAVRRVYAAKTRQEDSFQYEEPEYFIEENKLGRVQKAVAMLSDLRKEAFVLKYTHNLTIKEIAEICDCSEGTIKSRLFYALKELKENLNR